MIHVETRVRVGEIANIIWRRLGSHIKCLVGDNEDDDFVLMQHDFDNNHHDKATISVAINGDMVVICSIHVIKIVLSVLGPDKIDIEISYKVGRKATGSIAECTRHKHSTRILGSSSDADVARDITAKLVHMITSDVDVLLNPHKAFDSKLDSSNTDHSSFDSKSEADASAEPRADDAFDVKGSKADLIDRALLAACKACEQQTFNGLHVTRAVRGRADQDRHRVCHGLIFKKPDGDEDEFDVVAHFNGLLTLEHPTFKYQTRSVKFDVDNPRTILLALRRALEDISQ